MKSLALTALIAVVSAAVATAQPSTPAPQPADPRSQTAPGTQPNPEPSAGQPAQPQVDSNEGKQSLEPRADRDVPVTFEQADKNTDGTVDREEAKNVPGFKFSRADTDKSNSVSRQEFQTAMASSPPRG